MSCYYKLLNQTKKTHTNIKGWHINLFTNYWPEKRNIYMWHLVLPLDLVTDIFSFFQKCISSPTLVYNSSNAFFTDLTSCNHMLHQLQCHSVKACIPNNGGQLKAVCTDNLCLTDHACPELTVSSDQRMVVQSKDGKCMDCRKYDDLKSRLQKLKNIGKECLPLATKSTGTYRPMFNPGLMAACLIICMYICRCGLQ